MCGGILMCSKNQLVPDFLVCRIEENALRLQFLDQSPCLSSGLHQAASKAAPLFPPSLGGHHGLRQGFHHSTFLRR